MFDAPNSFSLKSQRHHMIDSVLECPSHGTPVKHLSSRSATGGSFTSDI